MKHWSLQEVLEATKASGTSFDFTSEQVFDSVCTDSRKVEPGCLFVPLVGENHDAHGHVQEAIEKGARASLWAHSEAPEGLPLLRVADSLQALQDLGRYHLRQRIKCQVVAITGSTGKTTCKDLLACLLNTRYRILKTPGNYNNDIGVPLTLLQLEADTQVAVLEIAMRGLEQIRRLARLISPDLGLITNIGVSHIELLGSRAAIAQAKGELFEEMAPESCAVAPADSDFFEYLKSQVKGRLLSFSGRCESSAQVKPLWREQRGLSGWGVEFEKGMRWDFPLPGEHHVEDLAACWAIARELKVDAEAAGAALREVRLSHLRMERQMLKNGLCLLNDAYNAAPDSMRSALQVLGYAAGRKGAVLGDMLELGSFSEQAHRELGEWVAQAGLDYLVAVGPHSRQVAEAAVVGGLPVIWVEKAERATAALEEFLEVGDTLLLKASRGIGLDRLVTELEQWRDDA